MPQAAKVHRAKQRSSVKTRRKTASQRGYGSRWQKARLSFLKNGNTLCVLCDRITLATVVDHIVPHRGDQQLFWDQNNWQPLCKSCHDKKTAKEDGGFGNWSQ